MSLSAARGPFQLFRSFLFIVTVAGCVVSAPAWADNILVNTNFIQNSGNNVPTGWTYFDDPTVPSATHNYWIGGTNTGGFFAPPLSGTQYWKEWGAGYFASANNMAGIYQTFGSSPGSVYQASGWVYSSSSDPLGQECYVWIDVSFLDANGNLLALYTSTNYTAVTGLDQWFRLDVTNACDLSAPVATGDSYFSNYAVAGAVSQLIAPASTAQVRYRLAYLQVNGAGGSCYFDDPALIQSAGLLPPVISNIYPQNMIFAPLSSGLSFDVNSPSGSTINDNAVHVVLNGLEVFTNLTITGSASNKTVSYQGLESNTTYTASITVMDAFGLSTTTSNYFQTTWVGIPPVLYLWEAEDFDFNSGMSIDFPDLCNALGDTNCYYGTVGAPGTDESGNIDGETASHLYRPGDEMNINFSGDLSRPNLFLADRPDYEINPFESGEWLNYTRDFTNGVYWIIARVATDITLSGSLTLSVVNADSSLTQLGTFNIAPYGLGWTTFENEFLVDTNGNKVNVTLNGKTTLQVKSEGNLLPTFFALVVATPDLPIVSGMYPTGTHPFEYTNALSFMVATMGSTFPANGIKVNVDGVDVSSNLVITGASSNETVVFPNLLPNATHTAVISATNSLGHGVLLTNKFDTFNQNNYMVQAADFDYSGGQYISDADWSPDVYQGLTANPGIDYQHTSFAGEEYIYRPDGIPQEQGHDYLTTVFVDSGGIEWDLAYFGSGDWVNYTRDYAPGGYFLYMRTAGLGANSMILQQVTSGAGASNQTVQALGNWNSVGVNNSTYYWVPLTDNGTAPAVVHLSGVETLRITTPTGDCYPNYFMLVPAGGISVAAGKSGNNISISFPSQSGVIYNLYSATDLTGGNWNLLTNVVANGTVSSVTVPPAAGARFYKVVAP